MEVSITPYNNPSKDYWLWAGPTPGFGDTAGMQWDATVDPPPSTPLGAGSLEIVQLIIPDLNKWTGLANNSIFGFYYTYSLNGQEVLDRGYPYGWVKSAPDYFAGDAPGLNLSGFGVTSAHIGNQFEDYLMYFAPGSIQPVPLAHFVWSVNGNATIPSTGNWADYGTGSAGTVTPSGTEDFSRSNSFPMWTGNYTDGYFIEH